jgi:hypothetical protein
MIKKIKEYASITLFAAMLLGGLIAPFYTPNFGLRISPESLYLPVPYL